MSLLQALVIGDRYLGLTVSSFSVIPSLAVAACDPQRFAFPTVCLRWMSHSRGYGVRLSKPMDCTGVCAARNIELFGPRGGYARVPHQSSVSLPARPKSERPLRWFYTLGLILSCTMLAVSQGFCCPSVAPAEIASLTRSGDLSHACGGAARSTF